MSSSAGIKRLPLEAEQFSRQSARIEAKRRIELYVIAKQELSQKGLL